MSHLAWLGYVCLLVVLFNSPYSIYFYERFPPILRILPFFPVILFAGNEHELFFRPSLSTVGNKQDM